MKFVTWSKDELQFPKPGPSRKGNRSHESIFALYIFASDHGFVRPGAIGINRLYDHELGLYSKLGNSASGRHRQYNQRPKDDEMSGRGTNKRRKLELLPWSGHPWRYIWLAELTEPNHQHKIGGTAISIAEQMLHFDMQAVFKDRGNSCVECPTERHGEAVEIAQTTVRRFEKLADEILGISRA
jgi:hypothetical protein